MTNTDEKNTLPNLETVLNAVIGLRQDITDLRSEMNERLINVETGISKIKELQFVFGNEIAGLLALSHKSLELSRENRAGVGIVRKEIAARSTGVRNSQRRVA